MTITSSRKAPRLDAPLLTFCMIYRLSLKYCQALYLLLSRKRWNDYYSCFTNEEIFTFISYSSSGADLRIGSRSTLLKNSNSETLEIILFCFVLFLHSHWCLLSLLWDFLIFFKCIFHFFSFANALSSAWHKMISKWNDQPDILE